MDKIQLSELLEKYVNGNCTPEEAAVIEQWYKKYADKLGHLDTLTVTDREFLKRKMFSNILNKVTDTEIVVQDEVTTKVVGLTSRWWFRLSAAAVLLILAKVFIFDGWISSREQQPVAQMYLVNNTHAIVKQDMPDGSIVWLTPNASLTFPKTFKTASRSITMKGKCFFEITKDPQRPFIISSKHIVTKVWGTSFQVSDLDDARQATVIVVSGKVSVSKQGSNAEQPGAKLAPGEVMLQPNQKVTYQQDKDVLITEARTDIAALSLWKRINLSFKNDKLSDIVEVLSNKFNVKMEVADPQLNDAAMTADLTDLNLPEILEVLKTSMKINYQISNDLITLKRTNN